MGRRWVVVALAVVVLTTAACSSGGTAQDDGDDSEVLGIQVDRETPSASPAAEATEDPGDEPSPAASTPSPAATSESPRPPPTSEPPDDPATTSAPPPPAQQTSAPPAQQTTPPPPPPSPTPSPTASPAAPLAEGQGNTMSWSPHQQEDGSWSWIVTSSTATDRSGPGHQGQAVAVGDARPDGDDQIVHAVCSVEVNAPHDRRLSVDGVVTTTMYIDDQATTEMGWRVDALIEAGETLRLGTTTERRVDAADGRSVRCTVSYDAE